MKRRRQGGFLLGKANRVAGRVFARLLREQGIEINPEQGRVLFALWQEDRIPISELARRTALGKSALTSMVDRLERQGYVERVPDAEDRRTIRVARTDKDRPLEAGYRRVSDDMTAVFYRGFSAAEIDRFEESLARILANLERAERSDLPLVEGKPSQQGLRREPGGDAVSAGAAPAPHDTGHGRTPGTAGQQVQAHARGAGTAGSEGLARRT